MDEPSVDPGERGSRPRKEGLGGTSWIVFFTPIALFGLAFVIPKAAGFLMMVAAVSAVGSSIICGAMAGRNKGSMGFLTFFGMLLLYAAIAYGGCAFYMVTML